MSLERTIISLNALQGLAKVIPVVGQPIEGVVQAINEGCRAAQVHPRTPKIVCFQLTSNVQGVKTNKLDSHALSERAALCIAAIVRELQKLDVETLQGLVGYIEELLLYVIW
jgi:hypothetical protein